MAILSFVMAGSYATFYSFNKSMKTSLEHRDQSETLLYAFETVHKAVRGISDVHQTTATVFEFTTTRMDGSTERIRYWYDSANSGFVAKSITNDTSRTLVDNVTAVAFTYYDRFGDETTTQIDMNAAKLELTSEREGANGTKSVDTETAMVTFRNRTL
ncbi:hypothetical protein [Ruficoccus sp. ZRK36]|uniref:hypothetical protein n=1 Tax=Ruficoccus sp. ZRK36 TaxID=2866311 RepID=UPI0021043CA8|nr:hypothetical protein [Ruficoccus sp. ZRK36]